MSNSLPSKFPSKTHFVIPSFMERDSVPLDFTKIIEGERRLIEARTVNVATYSDLEFAFNDAYREAKANLAEVSYEIDMTEKIIRRIKSEYLLDEYPDFLKEKKLKDNAAIREAFLERQEEYVKATDRLAMLKALEKMLEGKIKVFENASRYMKKQMDLIIRSGMDSNKYVR